MSTLEIRLAFYGVLLAAIGGWLAYERFHLIDEGEARNQAKLVKSSAELLAKANDKIQQQTVEHTAFVADNRSKTDALLKANAALSDSLDQRVRDFDAYRHSHPDLPRPAGGPAAASSGECGAQGCGELAAELAVRGNELARSVGELSAVLQGSQRDRDSLTGLPR